MTEIDLKEWLQEVAYYSRHPDQLGYDGTHLPDIEDAMQMLEDIVKDRDIQEAKLRSKIKDLKCTQKALVNEIKMAHCNLNQFDTCGDAFCVSARTRIGQIVGRK